MRRPRKFKPSTTMALEGRVVMSHVFHLTADLDFARPPANVAQTLAPTDMVPGAAAAPAGGNTFPLDIADTLAAGLPVYEQRQVVNSNQAVNEFIDELIVPNLATGGSTTTEWIQGAGFEDQSSVEKVVEVKTVNNGTTTNNITTTLPDGTVQTEVETAVTSGNTTTHTDVTTLPSGAVQTNAYTDVQKGNRILVEHGSEPAPNGSVETYSGVKHTIGDKTYTDLTYDQRARLVKHTATVVVNLGDSGETEAMATTKANGPEIITNETTTVSRLNPPTS